VALRNTLRQGGYRMPAEFEEHKKTWMIWPERPDVWRDNAIHAQHAYVTVAEIIAEFEPVTMCASKTQWEKARAMLPRYIRVVEMSSNDAWMRDQGPTFVVNKQGEVCGVDWKFNAWGGIYSPWDQDELIAWKVLEIEGVNRYGGPMVLEGGSIEVDGEGTLITTEECLLNSNRNPDLTKQNIERNLSEHLGVEKIIWLPRGVYNDTSGHIDNLCRFVQPGVLVLTWTDDKSDPQYEISNEAYNQLIREKDAKGRPFVLVKIPQPEPLFITKEEVAGLTITKNTAPRIAGDRLPASYVNFFIVDNGVLVPTFDDPQDPIALQTLQKLLPHRRVVQVYSREILLGGGNIHCITLQQPFGK